MKRFRLLAYASAALVALLVGLLVVGFSSAFQTWLVRRQLAARPEWKGTVGSVSAGWSRVEVRELRLERDGVVVTVPALEAELPLVSAVLRDRLNVARVTAKGWTLDLSKAVPAGVAADRGAAGAKGNVASANATNVGSRAATAAGFEGIFSRVGLPFDLAIEQIEAEGEVILPALRGRVKTTLRGAGLAAGREGKFDVTAVAALHDPEVNSVDVRGTLAVAMDTARSFTRLAARFEAEARGAKFPTGVKLGGELTAARAAAGETYSASLGNAGRQLAIVHAEFPAQGSRLTGTWKFDVGDADVAPFTLGQKLPVFTVRGEGRIETDAALAVVQGGGRLDVAADQLAVLRPELAALGAVTLGADFDMARRGDTIAISKLDVQLGGAKPVARVQALQAFEFNPKSRAILATEPSRDLAGIALQGLPLAWIAPFVRGVTLGGGGLSGEFTLAARGGGMALRASRPVSANNVSLASGKVPLFEAVDLSTKFSADYAPRGWQVEIAELSATSAGAALWRIDARAGQLQGAGEAVKTTGTLTLELPALLAQPVLREQATLEGGRATIEFAASLQDKTELHANIALRDLAAPVKNTRQPLPELTVDMRLDIAPGGLMTVNAPLVITQAGRKTDLAFTGTVHEKERRRVIDARITGSRVFVDDVAAFAGVAVTAPAKTVTPVAPPWAGFAGTATLQLARVIYGESFEATDVAGTVRLEASAVKIELVRAGVGEGGSAKIASAVTFEASSAQPYALAADIALSDFDAAPLLKAFAPAQPPVIDGRFNVSSQLASRAASVGELAAGAGGEFRLTSRGGVFRGLPINVSNLVENQSRIASWIASASAAIGSIAGKRDESDVASKVQAASELAKGLYPIAYDQLSVVLSRDAALNTHLKDFTLISPELRLTGAGRTTHQPAGSLLTDALAMEFSLRAQGRPGQMLKYLGALEGKPDDFGYAACTVPIKIGGSIGKPDASDLNNRVIALVLEKSGIIDRAMELFGKPRNKQASTIEPPR